MEKKKNDLIEEYKVEVPAEDAMIICPQLTNEEVMYTSKYPSTVVNYVDYCFFSEFEYEHPEVPTDDVKKLEYEARMCEEDAMHMFDIRYGELQFDYYKDDAKGLRPGSYISNNTVNIYSILLNREQISNKSDETVFFYFNSEVFVSKQNTHSKLVCVI